VNISAETGHNAVILFYQIHNNNNELMNVFSVFFHLRFLVLVLFSSMSFETSCKAATFFNKFYQIFIIISLNYFSYRHFLVI